MNVIDIIAALLLALGFYKGFKNGLLIEMASIIALVAGSYCAFHFSDFVAEFLSDQFQWNEKYLNSSAFIITFLIVLWLVYLLGKILTKLVQVLLLGMVNRILGGVFGLLKILIILGVLLVFLDEKLGVSSWISEKTIETSLLYEIFIQSGSFIYHQIVEHQFFDHIRSWF